MQRSHFRFALLVSALAATAFASADVAYDSFSLGGSNPFSGRSITGTPLQYSAQQFTSSLTGKLDSIQIAGNASGGGAVTLEVYSDNAGTLGSLLTSAQATFSMYSTPTTLLAGNVTLTTGGKYWVGLRTTSGSSASLQWNPGSLLQSGLVATNYLESNASLDAAGPLGAMRVNVTPQAVPEPATMAALGLGAAAMLRRRKRA